MAAVVPSSPLYVAPELSLDTLHLGDCSLAGPSRIPQESYSMLWDMWLPGTDPSRFAYFPPSPSDSSSSSITPPPPPARQRTAVRVVQCNAPLVAPKPLPYHSPRFLQFELLPDMEEDLSHPPYTRRVSKRKREASGAEDGPLSSESDNPPQKRWRGTSFASQPAPHGNHPNMLPHNAHLNRRHHPLGYHHPTLQFSTASPSVRQPHLLQQQHSTKPYPHSMFYSPYRTRR